jgi:hypothetical protein
MKKIALLFVATTLLISTAYRVDAQDDMYSGRNENSYSGIKGGFNLSTLSIDNYSDKNLKPGFHVGVFSKIGVTEHFAIQPELLYSLKGLKYSYDDTQGASGDSKFNLHYVDLPVYMVFNLSPDFAIQAGPYVSYLAYANEDTDATILDAFNIDRDKEIDRDNFNSFDYGLSAGMTFDLNPLLLGFNYNLGLKQVAKEDSDAETLLGDAHNNVIQVFVGLRF